MLHFLVNVDVLDVFEGGVRHDINSYDFSRSYAACHTGEAGND